MFSFEDLDILKQALAGLGNSSKGTDGREETGKKEVGKGKGKDNRKNKEPGGRNDSRRNGDSGGNGFAEINRCINLTPSQLLVIAGFLTGVLDVDSVLVDKNQAIEIVLTGTLKKPTQLDAVISQIGKLPFDRVIKALMDNS